MLFDRLLAAARRGSAKKAAEVVRRGRLPTLKESFPEQWAYETSTALYNAVMCSRRAGKTRGAVRRHARVLATAQEGSWTHFGSLIRRNARKHFWNPLKQELDRLGWHYDANNTEMILKLENGNWCQAFGCDDEAGTKAVQGDHSALFTIDECHLPNEDILKMLIEVSEPMLTDRGGMLDLLGLPPETEGGFFANILDGLDEEGEPIEGEGFKVFSWTMFDHDFPRKRETKLADVKERCRRRGLPIVVDMSPGPKGRPIITVDTEKTHPLVQRNYFGKRAKDPGKLAYEYEKGRNDYDPATVDFSDGPWLTSWGIDLGFQDHDSLSVTKWRKDDPEHKLRVPWVWQCNHLDVLILADILLAARHVPELRPNTVSGDHGGHGAVKVMETISNVLRMTVKPKPGDVMVSVGFVNDELRTARLTIATDMSRWPALVEASLRKLFAEGKLLAKTPEELEERVKALHPKRPPNLPAELQKVTKVKNPRTGKIEINKKGFHSDLSESLRYGVDGAIAHYRSKAPKPEKTWEEKRAEQLRKRRRDEMDPYR